MTEKNNNKIKITIYGYDVAVIDEATKLVSDKILQLKLTFSGPIPFPNKRKTATVLISPHKHKKAQEKFEQITHKRVIYLNNISSNELKILEKLEVPETAHLEVKSPA
jgi:small subunit ribosomal protein S10